MAQYNTTEWVSSNPYWNSDLVLFLYNSNKYHSRQPFQSLKDRYKIITSHGAKYFWSIVLVTDKQQKTLFHNPLVILDKKYETSVIKFVEDFFQFQTLYNMTKLRFFSLQ